MKINTLKLVCFSPTGTSKAIIEGIAKGLDISNPKLIDITKPKTRKAPLETSENELLIVAVPVYMGRIPALLSEWFSLIKAKNTPTVCVVVYGNRAYENALLELHDLLQKQGCKPIAGAAFIGEHSFSSPELPSSEGRPDNNDLYSAVLFGKKIKAKLAYNTISNIDILGSKPYGGVTDLWKVDFIAINGNCIQCGQCSENCPTGAIGIENSCLIDIEKCTLCCACIKNCQQNAKFMKPGLMKDAAIRSNTNFKVRKEPELFL